MAAIACAWLRKNVFQVCDGDPPRTMYFETVDWATSKPSINSTPWIPRCSPPRRKTFLRTHAQAARPKLARELRDLIRRARFRDFQRQNAVKPARCQRRMVSG